jgi:hypothetical protein
MMKNFTIICLLLLPTVLMCQDTAATKTSTYEIGITYSPDYSYRTLKPNEASKWIADIRDTLEIAKFGYTTGLNMEYHLNKKITLAAGLLWSDKGEQSKTYTIENPVSGYVPTELKMINHNYYLDIPVKVNYYVFSKKMKLYVTAGISTNVFLNQKITVVSWYYDGTTSNKTSASKPDFKRLNIAAIAGIGMDVNISSKFNLKIEPLLKHSITSATDTPIKTYFYSAGLNFGIFYNL